MRIRRKAKIDFPKDPNDRTILKTAEEIAAWVNLGFQEQKKKYKEVTQERPFELVIDLSNCNLSTFCNVDKNGNENRIFNLCDLAGIVDGINHLKEDNGYLFEIIEDINFSNSILHGAFFHYVVFKGRVRFDDAQVISNTSFSKCTFYAITSFVGMEFPSTTSFTNCNFKDNVYMQKAKIHSFSTEFWSVIFEKTFDANALVFVSPETTVHGHDNFILFRECSFNGRTVFSNIKFTLSTTFLKCIYSDYISFENSIFSEMLLIEDSIVSNIMLFSSYTSDEQNNIITFEKLTLKSVKVIGDIHIERENIKELNCYFSSVKSEGRLRISESSINKFIFLENSINGRVDVIECQIDKIDLNATIVVGYFNLLDTELEKRNISNRNTAQILKNESSKLNNIIQSVQMKQIEMNIYMIELLKKLKRDKRVSFSSYLKNIPLGRILLLLLNFCSNGFGLKWVQGILFTMTIALLFFILINFFGIETPIFIIDFKFNNFGEVWKGYLNILNVLNFRDKLDGIELNAWGESLFFVSKIFLSYGIYQTVSAFRKYGK